MSIFDHVIAQSQKAPPIPQNNDISEMSDPSEFNIFQAAQNQPPQKEAEPRTFSSNLKHASRIGARGLEVAVGALASPIELAQQGVIAGTEYLTGKDQPEMREKAEQYFQKTGLPRSKDVRKKLSEWTGGYTEPQSTSEEREDEVVEDVASLLLPTPGGQVKVGGKVAKWLGPQAAKYMKVMGTVAAGQAAKEGASMLGATEGQQSATKLGAMIFASAINPKQALKLKTSLYDKAKTFLPANANTDVKTLQSGFNFMKRKLNKGIPTLEKKPALDAIDQFEKKISNGRVPVEELQQFKKDLYNIIGDWKSDKISHPHLKKLAKVADTQLQRYGKNHNPEWLKNYKAADRIHQTIAQSDKARNTIKNYVIPLMKKNPLWALPVFGLGSVAYPGLKAFELGHRIFRNPKLAALYTTTLANATKENIPAAARSMTQLNDELGRELGHQEEIDLSQY